MRIGRNPRGKFYFSFRQNSDVSFDGGEEFHLDVVVLIQHKSHAMPDSVEPRVDALLPGRHAAGRPAGRTASGAAGPAATTRSVARIRPRSFAEKLHRLLPLQVFLVVLFQSLKPEICCTKLGFVIVPNKFDSNMLHTLLSCGSFKQISPHVQGSFWVEPSVQECMSRTCAG